MLFVVVSFGDITVGVLVSANAYRVDVYVGQSARFGTTNGSTLVSGLLGSWFQARANSLFFNMVVGYLS